jgi:Zn finger protein HypA/HybF involved in hydrogenase expression
MKKIKNIADKVMHNSVSPYRFFQKRTFEVAAETELRQKDHYDSNIGLYWFCLVLTFALQGASAVSEWGFFFELVSVQLTGASAYIATGFSVLLIETAKFFVINAALSGLFVLGKARVQLGLILIGLALSAVSIYASVMGGGEFGIDTEAIVTTDRTHSTEVARIRKEIDDIQERNTWKGKTWLPKAEKKLLQAKEQQLTAAINNKGKAISTIEAENMANRDIYRYWFAAFELGYLLATIFVWSFRRRVAVESLLKGDDDDAQQSAPPVQQQVSSTAHQHAHIPHTAGAAPVVNKSLGFQFGLFDQQAEQTPVEKPVEKEEVVKVVVLEGHRECAHCGKAFKYNSPTHVYCGEKCRITAWEIRTGKKVFVK